MIFKNEEGKSAKLTVEDCREDLKASDVQSAMQTIIDKNIFSMGNGELREILSANIITTDTEAIIEKQ